MAQKLTVDDYIAKLDQGWQADLCRRLREIILESAPDVEEQIKWGTPHYTINGQYVCLFFGAKKWVNFTIFNRDRIEAPANLFEVTEYPTRGTLKIKEGTEPDFALLARLIKQSAAV